MTLPLKGGKLLLISLFIFELQYTPDTPDTLSGSQTVWSEGWSAPVSKSQ